MNVSGARWRKSSFSQQGGNCVEVADGFPGIAPVRDSKDPEGPALTFASEGFAAFIEGVKNGEFSVT
ncbi:DUF397 domain-containing protein [Kitasatospora sp. RB6PN24]|uniref:DUF397 domain-containing protein n=1 Tax=Kitasatospora humi TaxID=2893891 RepID=UPI001E4AB597|nr:DUF397 domain-containing protein [Kitasatospora humi]MCC9311448.1 DUF397 domain-containing protein [Kitasatospora humi]